MSDHLLQFKNMPKETQLGESAEIEEKNKEYKKPLKKPLSETKEELKGLFGSFGVGEKEEKKGIESKEKDIERKIDENPKSPLVDLFCKEGFLSVEEGNLIKESFISGGDLESCISSVKELGNDKKDHLIKSLNYLENDDVKDNCKESFNNAFPEKIEGLKEDVVGSKNGEKDFSLRTKVLVDLVGENYFILPGKEGEKANDESLNTAFKIAVNKLIDGKNLGNKRDSESFKSAMLDIKGEGSFEEKFKALKYIDSLVQTKQGLSGKKANTVFNKIRGEHALVKQEYMDFKIEQLELQIETTKNEGEKLKLNKQLKKLEKEKLNDDFSKGEVLSGGKDDKIADGNESVGENK